MPTSMTSSTTEAAQSKHYLAGLKLFTLLASLTLVAFLVLLDTSIIGTVRYGVVHFAQSPFADAFRLSHASRLSSILSTMLGGMLEHIRSPRMLPLPLFTTHCFSTAFYF